MIDVLKLFMCNSLNLPLFQAQLMFKNLCCRWQSFWYLQFNYGKS